ncbi:MAG: hypothetical protein IAF02_20565 [Anaerolineae bacterium]|nr:hypothetical protein [Anaerolineae bacterium]
MSISFDPTTLLYAVVEYLKSSEHIYDPVDAKPEQDGQYRLVCLAVNSDEAWRVARILRALSDGRYWYNVCVAEPESLFDDNVSDALCDSQAVASEPLNLTP